MKYKKDGELFDINALHVIDDVQYPVGWFHNKENRDAHGLTEEPDDPPVTPLPLIPETVTRRQARQALLMRGLLDKVAPAITAMDNGTPEGKQKMMMAQIEWDDSLNFERSRPLLTQLGYAIGLDDAGLDDLFIYAATL